MRLPKARCARTPLNQPELFVRIAQRGGGFDRVAALACPRDRVVVIGGRDDTLTAFAREILERV